MNPPAKFFAASMACVVLSGMTGDAGSIRTAIAFGIAAFACLVAAGVSMDSSWRRP